MDQTAGKIAQKTKASSKTVITAANPMPTAEEPAKSTKSMGQKSMASSGTLSVMKASIMSAAASARQTARLI